MLRRHFHLDLMLSSGHAIGNKVSSSPVEVGFDRFLPHNDNSDHRGRVYVEGSGHTNLTGENPRRSGVGLKVDVQNHHTRTSVKSEFLAKIPRESGRLDVVLLLQKRVHAPEILEGLPLHLRVRVHRKTERCGLSNVVEEELAIDPARTLRAMDRPVCRGQIHEVRRRDLGPAKRLSIGTKNTASQGKPVLAVVMRAPDDEPLPRAVAILDRGWKGLSLGHRLKLKKKRYESQHRFLLQCEARH